jgi:hypothetical protein
MCFPVREGGVVSDKAGLQQSNITCSMWDRDEFEKWLEVSISKNSVVCVVTNK